MGLFTVNEAPHIKISIARDFTISPGARSIKDGPKSGEEFRQNFLDKHFKNSRDEIIQIDLDGVEGYATSFLEEAFGGLAREYGKELVEQKLQFISDEDPVLINEIKGYIRSANS